MAKGKDRDTSLRGPLCAGEAFELEAAGPRGLSLVVRVATQKRGHTCYILSPMHIQSHTHIQIYTHSHLSMSERNVGGLELDVVLVGERLEVVERYGAVG